MCLWILSAKKFFNRRNKIMTKRLVSVLVAFLMVMALIPMSVFATEASMSGDNGFAKKDISAEKSVVTGNEANASVRSENGWQFVDLDGDGYNWEWQQDYSETPHYTAYEGEGVITSKSYDNDTGSALTPNNWAISPAIELAEGEASVSFYAAGQDASWAAEHFAIYAGASADTAEMTKISNEFIATGDYTQYTADLSAFSGDTVYVAVRHYNTTDMFVLDVDNFEVSDSSGVVYECGFEADDDVVDPTEEPVVPTEAPVLVDFDSALNVEGGTLHFETSANYPWTVETEGDREYAMSGNAGVGSSTSTITATVSANEGDIVKFDYKAWGEGSNDSYDWDNCRFYVDNNLIFRYGAHDNDWESFMYELTAGQHELKWQYKKDDSVNPDGDFFAVDNVYVGEPAMPEQIVATESIEVPVNRTGNIEWSVLPENATNKDVTFVCDDTSIATVSDKGVVFGVAEGETFVTITSVADPSVFAVCEVNVVDTGLTCANIYGICTYDFAEVDESTWVTFTDVDPSSTTVIGTEPGAYAAAYAYGNVYGFTTGGAFFKASFEDISNPDVIEGVTNYTITSMTYDYTRGGLIGVAIDDSDNSLLVMADPDSGTIMEIGELETHLLGIAVDENGNGYGIDNYGDLYSVDFDTANITLIGYTDVYCSYVQDICYDFNTGDLYWAQIASLDSHGLYRINKETASAEYLGAIGQEGMEIVGMFIIPDEEPEPGEDVSVESISVSPDEVEIHVGDTAQFNAIVRPFNASNKNIEWGVDDESIIAVDQNGLVIGLAEGTAMVYATTEDGEYTDYALVNVLPPLGEKVAGYYFEDEAEVTSWQFIDADGDGYNWSSTLLEGITNMTPYEGENIIFSESYSNVDSAVLNPDNWAISPAIELNGTSATVTLYARGQDANYAAEHFAIYAGLTDDPAEMTMLTDELIATGEYVCYEADLSQFVGEEVYIAIRHYNVSDEFILNIDQVEVWCNDSEPTEHIWGDADGDGDVDMNDVLLIMRYVMELDTIAPANLDPWCDVNCDGVVNMTDALLISRYIIDIVPVLPVAGDGE